MLRGKHDMLVDVQDMRCVLAVFNTFLSRKTSLSASSGLRHHAQLRPHRLKIFSMWVNLRLFHCIYGHDIYSDMQPDYFCNSCPPGPFLLIRVTMIK